MKHLNLLFLSTAALLAASLSASLSGCGGGGGTADPAPPPPPPAALAPQVTLTVSNGAGVTGNIVITLTPTQTPVTVNNFLAYVASGHYVGTVFHRHQRDFVLQGGGYAGPLVAGSNRPMEKGPLLAPIALEVGKGLSNVRYSIAMARTDVLNSATSQFFINTVDNARLDTQGGGYAVFGNVTSGTDVITAMVAAPCSAWAAFLDTACLPSPNITITAAVKTR